MSKLGIAASSLLGFGVGAAAGGIAGDQLEKRVGYPAALSRAEARLGGAAIGAALGAALLAAFAAPPDAPKQVGTSGSPTPRIPRFP